MIEQTRFEKLFSTPLVRFRVANHKALSKKLLAEAALMRAKDDGVRNPNGAAGIRREICLIGRQIASPNCG